MQYRCIIDAQLSNINDIIFAMSRKMTFKLQTFVHKNRIYFRVHREDAIF